MVKVKINIPCVYFHPYIPPSASDNHLNLKVSCLLDEVNAESERLISTCPVFIFSPYISSSSSVYRG